MSIFSTTRVPSHKYSNYEPLLLKISYTISIGRHQEWGRGGAKMQLGPTSVREKIPQHEGRAGAKMQLGPTTLLIMSVLLVCCNHCSTQKAVRC